MKRRLLIRALQKALQPAARGLSKTRLGSTVRGGGLTAKETMAVGAVPALAAPGIAWAAGNVSPLSEMTQREIDYMDAEDARMSELWRELESQRMGYAGESDFERYATEADRAEKVRRGKRRGY